jgi:hypothetical protein
MNRMPAEIHARRILTEKTVFVNSIIPDGFPNPATPTSYPTIGLERCRPCDIIMTWEKKSYGVLGN